VGLDGEFSPNFLRIFVQYTYVHNRRRLTAALGVRGLSHDVGVRSHADRSGRAEPPSRSTRQFIVAWNGDGKLDIVTGNFEVAFFWFNGDGKGKSNRKPESIIQSVEPQTNAGVHSDPFVVDWDGVGDLDLLRGSSDT